jgi:hypothetical protein
MDTNTQPSIVASSLDEEFVPPRRVRQHASLARRYPCAHPRPARALCPALHDHFLIHLPSFHRLHRHLFKLGRRRPPSLLYPSVLLITIRTHSPSYALLEPAMLFLRARDMSRSHGPFRWCSSDGARGGQASGNTAALCTYLQRGIVGCTMLKGTLLRSLMLRHLAFMVCVPGAAGNCLQSSRPWCCLK